MNIKIGDRVFINAANTIFHGDSGIVIELPDINQYIVKLEKYGEWLFYDWQLIPS